MSSAPVSDDARPHLARGTRLDYDDVRERHVLLVPEGRSRSTTPRAPCSSSATASGRSATIVAELGERYGGADVGDDVRELLVALAERGLVRDVSEKPFTLVAELTYRCPLHCPYCSNPLTIGDAHYKDELSDRGLDARFREARASASCSSGSRAASRCPAPTSSS